LTKWQAFFAVRQTPSARAAAFLQNLARRHRQPNTFSLFSTRADCTERKIGPAPSNPLVFFAFLRYDGVNLSMGAPCYEIGFATSAMEGLP
jgi:hypothetical protein